MEKARDKAHKFFEILEDTFVGERIEGEGGYVNLLKVKSEYFRRRIRPELERLISESTKSFPEFREELLDKLYDFFHKYLNETGTPFIALSPYYSSVFDRIYDGRDVKLYWKTSRHYYVKSDKAFKTMEVEVDGFKILFDASSIEYKKNNEKRQTIYLFHSFNKEKKRLTLKVSYSERGKRTKIDEIRKEIKKAIGARKYTKEIPSSEILEKAIRIFERQAKIDYFICKEAESFLKEQFDLWINQYILGLVGHEDGTVWTEKRIKQLQTLKKIAYRVIEWISLFENELLKIWLKPRFALKANYVITLDRIAQKGGIELIKKILSHPNVKKQVEEWKRLEIVGKEFKPDQAVEKTLRGEELKKEYQFLPIDTKYFKDLEGEILSLFSDIDKELDGWLIKSENFQALNTILPKFREKVQTIYIDPPFNKEQNADYDYLVDYKNGTWATMLHNRLELAREFLKDSGAIFVRCDYNGNWIVRPLMNEIFGEENFRNEISVRRFKKNVMEKEVKKLPEGLDTIYAYAKDGEKFSYISPFKEMEEKREGFWRHMGDSSGQGKPKVFFGKELEPPKGKHWKFSQERIDKMIEEGKLILQCRHCGYIHDKSKGVWRGCPECGKDDPQPKYWVEEKSREVLDSNWSDIYGYSTSWGFQTENSEALLKRVIELTSREGDLVMDFFLGSGTTAAVAHKLGRRWIGVEMGEHFYRVVLPRMKKVLAYDRSGISKEKDVKEKYNGQRAGGFFKYLELEQYEEILRTVRYKDVKEGWESLPQENLFTVDQKLLDSVEKEEEELYFNPKLLYPGREVDLAETISYLKGLAIKRISKELIELEGDVEVELKGGKVKLSEVADALWWR